MNSDRYDVAAKAEDSATFEQMRPMLQSLVVERFKLVVDRETKELPVYDLVVAKGGLKLTQSRPGNCVTPVPGDPPPPELGGKPPVFCGAIRMGRGLVDTSAIPMPRLAAVLAQFGNLGRQVIDKTGLTGNFDVHLEYAPDEGLAGGPPGQAPSTDSSGPSIFTALQEQLGLKLESSKAPVEMLVIDHVERPSEN